VISKDGLAQCITRIIQASQQLGMLEVLCPDNNILASAIGGTVAQITHIVPEWYLLTVYHVIKRVPQAHLGVQAVAGLLFGLSLFGTTFAGAVTSSTGSNITSVSVYVVSSVLLAQLGAQLPLSIVLAAGKLFAFSLLAFIPIS
jgi:quinol-cytochrome oxidoreductase complex cytochrome b subunit